VTASIKVESLLSRIRGLANRGHATLRRSQSRFISFLGNSTPRELPIVGRVLLHAATVGLAAGVVGAALFAAFEYTQRLLLEEAAGYLPLRADGETFAAGEIHHRFLPWLLAFLPALGGLGCGLVTKLVPEARGGGGDATIEAFHQRDGQMRRRVIWVKALASVFTLGTGGAGGREGPTMQIGGALGSFVARLLNLRPRERRVLMVAGVAAGISAVFRTPLGAALLAVEFLYKDGFESDALVPSVLASVVSYSVIISIFGESTLFARVPRFAFVPAHLPLYGVLAIVIAAMSAAFVALYARVHGFFYRLRVAEWVRPALGGLALGVLVTPLIYVVGERIHEPGQGFGLLGGGYGAVQMAIAGSPWLPEGWTAVGLLVVLSLAKAFAATLTIGSGGSAGDFAPSLAIGGLVGGAFGRAAELLFHDPRIQPGAFALVGMGTFYGGIAHVPLSALVLVCELAGNYDLLVPLMLAQGIAFVASRNRSLYPAQLATPSQSPAHQDTLLHGIFQALRVSTVAGSLNVPACFALKTTVEEMLNRVSLVEEQDVFPVVDDLGKLVGLVTSSTLRIAATDLSSTKWTIAADLMRGPVSVFVDDDLRRAVDALFANDLRELPVVNNECQPVGMIGESDIVKVYLQASVRAESALPR